MVSAPGLQLFYRICGRQEPVGVQAPGPEAAVEGFDEGLVRRLAGPGQVQGDAVGTGLQDLVGKIGKGVDLQSMRATRGLQQGRVKLQRARAAGTDVAEPFHRLEGFGVAALAGQPGVDQGVAVPVIGSGAMVRGFSRVRLDSPG